MNNFNESKSEELFSHIIHHDGDRGVQVRLTVNMFREVEYLHIRKYYLDFSGEWMAGKEGASMPLTLSNAKELLVGVLSILADAEPEVLLEEGFKDLLSRKNL